MTTFGQVEECSRGQPFDSLVRREVGSSATTTAVGKSGAQTTDRDRGHGSASTRAYVPLRLLNLDSTPHPTRLYPRL